MSDVDAEILSNLEAVSDADGNFMPLDDSPGDAGDGASIPAGLRAPDLDGAPAEEADAADVYEDDEAGVRIEPEGGDDDEPEEAPAPDQEQEAASQLGSESDPYKLADFRDDEYITVTEDGEEVTVPLKQRLQDGMRQATFDKRAARLNRMIEQTHQTAEAIRQRLHTTQKGFLNVVSDPDALSSFLKTHHPETLHALLLTEYPALHKMHTEGRLEQYMRQCSIDRDQRLTRQREEALQRRQHQEQQQAFLRERRNVALPAIRKAIQTSGVTNISQEQAAELCDALDAADRRVQRTHRRHLNGPELSQVAERWLRANVAEEAPRERKPRQRGRRQAPAPVQAAKTNGRRKREVSRLDDFGQISTEFLLSAQR